MNILFRDRFLSLIWLTCVTAIFALYPNVAAAQKRRPINAGSTPKNPPAKRAAPATAVVVDERLSVLRFEPDLSAIPLQRMRAGRTMQILGSQKTGDGVTH